MQDNEPTIKKLVAVIQKHLPGSPDKMGATNIEEGQSQRYAYIILYAFSRGVESFGISNDVDQWQSLEMHLLRAVGVVKQLSEPGRFMLKSELSIAASSETNCDLSVETLEHFLQVVKQIRSFPKSSQNASKKANDLAASIAQACRKVWGEGHWKGTRPSLPISPAPIDESRLRADQAELRNEYLDFVANCAPRSVHNDTPGPFGRFLEDVFGVLGIYSSSGEPVRASSALVRLAHHERQEKNFKK